MRCMRLTHTLSHSRTHTFFLQLHPEADTPAQSRHPVRTVPASSSLLMRTPHALVEQGKMERH